MSKITPPNYTQVPNILMDEWLTTLKEVELKVLLVIMRKTFGWHKEQDRISLSQLEKITGCARGKICDAVKSLEAYELIKKEVVGEIGRQQTFYELIIHEDSNNSNQCQIGTPPSTKLTPPPSTKLVPTKETYTKETLTKEKAPLPLKNQAEKKQEVPVSSAGAASSFLLFKNAKGHTDKIEESLVYRHFLGKKYQTIIVSEAIQIVRDTGTTIGNIFKFIEAICQRLTETPKKPKIDQEKTEKERLKQEEYNKKLEEHNKLPKGRINVGNNKQKNKF